MGELRVMGADVGDHKVEWDPKDKESVHAAKHTFKRLVDKGWLAFAVKGDDKDQITEFDPDVEHIVFAPPAVGG